MKNFLNRLFIQLPLLIIWVGLSCLIGPITSWLITGDLDWWFDLPTTITKL